MRSNTGWRAAVLKTQLPTPERLREVFHYDPGTGVFTWRISPNTRAPVGSVAGTRAGNYIALCFEGKRMSAHRAAVAYVTGQWPTPDQHIDHRDCNGAHNAWANLRVASAGQNSINKRVSSSNALGVKGVRRLRGGRYQARLHGKGLGTFDTAEEAGAAYVAAARAIHGEFAHA